jgi:hypothetical protein
VRVRRPVRRRRPQHIGAQLGTRCRFHQVADGPSGDGIEQVPFGFGDGEDDDPGDLPAGPGDGDPSASGHVEVAHHQIGTGGLDGGDGVVGVGRFADDLETVA